MSWYSVKCLFYHPTRKVDGDNYLYEERTTLWSALSFGDAYSKAEVEAQNYANESDSVFVQAVSAFHLFEDEIKEGVEIYSLMRGSNLDPFVYRDTFCNTNRDRVTDFKK